MRDEHADKLKELQNVQRVQLETIKSNENKLLDMVNKQQNELKKLTDDNKKLAIALKNQQLLTAYISKMVRTYKNIEQTQIDNLLPDLKMLEN